MSVTAVAPRVSVLMPTWNHAHFIGRAIASLLAQELSAWELLIVDDASPDDAARVVQPFLDDTRIRYRRLPDNRGLGAARNAGLDDARAAAGLPVLQRDNRGCSVATQTLAREPGIGLFFDDMAGLRRALDDGVALPKARDAMRRERHRFTFDHHVPALVGFLREVVARDRSARSISLWQPTAR